MPSLTICDPSGSRAASPHARAVLDHSYQKGVQVYVFAVELRRLCKKHGYNLPALFAQAWHETAGFASDAWRYRMNPAGLKNRSGSAYQRFYNGVDAARALVVHHSAYVAPPRLSDDLAVYRFLDDRYGVAAQANVGRRFTTFDDLAGFWAEDPLYGRKIARVFRELFGAEE